MFKDSGNGYIEIENVRCFLPKQPEPYHIINYGLKKKDQKWRRQELPTFKATDIDIFDGTDYKAEDVITWEEAVRQEKIGQTGCDPWSLDRSNNPKKVDGVTPNPDYCGEAVNAFRRQELDRIFNGVWVYINGQAVYLTGIHYFYLTYFFLDGKYPEFRWTDVKFFYLIEVVRHVECPHLGLVYITRRGSGKSFKCGAVAYYVAITKRYAHVGIQSKTDEDAETFFKTKILQPMTKLPEFLIPHNPHTGDITQVKKLEFAPPAKKNIDIKVYNKIKKESLYTFIDFRNASEGAYDSTTLACKISDEFAKLDPKKVANAEVRLQKTIFCVLRGVEKKGFTIEASTIEKHLEGGKEAQKIYLDSDPTKLNKNGRTVSGLIRLFTSALEDTFFDEYGYSLVDKAREYHEAERAKYIDDPAGLVSYKQKNPHSIEEAFWFGSNKCIYNAEILLAAKDRIINSERKLTRRGDFVWREKDKEAMWVDNDINGRWECSMFLDKDQANQVQVNPGQKPTFTPLAGHKRVLAFDPFASSSLADENKGSNAAIVVFNKFDYNTPEDYCNTIIADYCYRPADPWLAIEDAIIAAHYFGAPILCETNKGDVVNYLKLRGYKWGNDYNNNDFSMKRPESTLTSSTQKATDGVYSTTSLIEQYTNSTANHIIHHGHKLKHMRVVEDWLNFDPLHTRRFDTGVAASLSVIAAEKKIDMKQDALDLSGMFKTWNNTGSYSSLN